MSERNWWGEREEGEDFWTEGDGGVWQVAAERDLPDAHPHALDFFIQLKASLDDDLTPGVGISTMLNGGEYDDLIAFAHLSGRAGEKVTTAEIEHVVKWASELLSDALLLLTALKGTFHMPGPRNGRAVAGLRERFRSQVDRRVREIQGDAPPEG